MSLVSLLCFLFARSSFCSFSFYFAQAFVFYSVIVKLPLSVFVMDPTLLCFAIAWCTGGDLFRRQYYVEFLWPLSRVSCEPILHSDFGGHDNFRYWHLILLFLSNPVVIVHYDRTIELAVVFIYSGFLLFYWFVCYIIALLVSMEFASIAYENLRRYNRGSIFRQTIYRCRCFARDLCEGHTTMPHLLHWSE